jgi:hypothetical protein
MPNAYVLNQIPTTYAQAHWLWIQMLVGAGWTFKASGDGLSAYSSTGSVFSNGAAAGANGLGQTRAWCRLTDPASVREICFQHDNSGGMRLKYSANAKFTTGGSATVTPSATDERYLRGAASDAVPSYGASFLDTGVLTGLTKFQGAAHSSAPYGFWFAGATTPAGQVKTAILMDPVSSAVEDTDPYVWFLGTTTGFYGPGLVDVGRLGNTSGGTGVGCFAFADVARSAFPYTPPAIYAFENASSGLAVNTAGIAVAGTGLAANPFNGKVDALPILFGRPGTVANPGLKGWSTFMRWTGVLRGNFQDTGDSLAWICVGHVWLPWDGTTVPTN